MTRITGLSGCYATSSSWLLVAIHLAALVVAQPVTYDQRQEGKVNVQVDVKDLQIVALVDSDFLGDYSYDYPLYDDADFTVKPSTKKTTIKPTSTTSEPISNTNYPSSTSSSSESSSSTVVDSTTAKATDEPAVRDTTVPVINTTLKITENTTAKEDVSSTTSFASTAAIAESTTRRLALGTAEPRKRCPTGFQMRSGRCFKRRHSLISPRAALMKLAPVLLAKSQLFGRHTTNAISS